MKRYLVKTFAAVITLTLTSWGPDGHKTVAAIADSHLTPQAREVVKRFLGNNSLADVASWADEILSTPEYRNTASWHYLRVPLGADYSQFETAVKMQQQANVYSVLLENEGIFIAVNSTKEQRTVALKFIIHLVGDIHQPTHILIEEDKGGDTTRSHFGEQGNKLNMLWDSTFQHLAIEHGKATKKQIKQWQTDDVMKWLYESYQISSGLDTEGKANNIPDDSYYQAQMPMVGQRIEMAGIRLAGLLNILCKTLEFSPDVFIKGTFTPNIGSGKKVH